MPDIAFLTAVPFEEVSHRVPDICAPDVPRYRLARQELAPPTVVTHAAPFFLGGADERQRRELEASTSIQTAAPFCARAAGIRVLARGLLLDDAGALLVSPQFHAWAGPDHPLRREILGDWVERDQPQPPGRRGQARP
jgi:hypothetical protein